MKKILLRALLALAALSVLSCGGGGGAVGDGGAGATVSVSAVDWGFGTTAASLEAQGGGEGGGGEGGSDGAGGGGNSASGTGGGTASASAGDSSGVGSGGTGASASAGDSGDSGVGGVGGVGSIIVNGVRYETGAAVLKLRDVPLLQLGMTVKVNGPTNAEFTTGTATEVESAVDLRGVVDTVDPASGQFTALGSTVITDSATVWGNLAGLSALAPGATVQVWALPAGAGVLRATRIERRGAATPILTGRLENLDAAGRRFSLGGLTVDYVSATVVAAALTPGTNVRVRAVALPVGGRLIVTSVEPWYPVSLREGARRQLGGVVTDFAGANSFRLLGTPVDASAAKVTGGSLASLASLGNGAEVEVAGTVSNGVLVATKLRIKKAPGGLNTAVFQASGPVGAFRSIADFKVKGQQVDASAADVRFVNGAAPNLRNGTQVTITGARIVNDVLIATQVVFD